MQQQQLISPQQESYYLEGIGTYISISSEKY